MARPTPHCGFLTDLAQSLDLFNTAPLKKPLLLSAAPASKYAVLAAEGGGTLHLFDRKANRIQCTINAPRRSGKPADYRGFVFSDNEAHFGYYIAPEKTFIVCAVTDGKVLNQFKGEGLLPGVLCFLSETRLAVSDGPRVAVHQIGGKQLFYTKLSDDLTSIILSKASGLEHGIIAAGVFRKEETGGYQLKSFVIQEGKILGTDDAPYRPGPMEEADLKNGTLHELLPSPSGLKKLLVLNEEERTIKNADSSQSFEENQYVTHVHALDPANGRFLHEELHFPGRHCLQLTDRELHLLDERGCRRRVALLPLRTELIDWRLAE